MISIRRGVFADKLALLPNGGGKGGEVPFILKRQKKKGKNLCKRVRIRRVRVRAHRFFELTRAEIGPTHERVRTPYVDVPPARNFLPFPR